jgi:hypothetical protein
MPSVRTSWKLRRKVINAEGSAGAVLTVASTAELAAA